MIRALPRVAFRRQPPVWAVTVALLVVASPARGQRVEITSADPTTVELKPADIGQKITLAGTGLGVFSDAAVVVDGGRSPDFDVELTYDRRRGELLLTVSARPAAAGQTGRIFLISADQRLEVPRVRVSVAAPPPELTGIQLAKSDATPGEAIGATLEFAAPMPRALAVQLSSSDPAVATVPDHVDVPGGAMSFPFEIVGGQTSGTATISALLEGVEVEATVYVTAPFTARELSVGSFTFTAAPLDPSVAFTPVELPSIGEFRFSAAKIDPYAAFEPVSLRVGSFVFTVQPPPGNDPEE